MAITLSRFPPLFELRIALEHFRSDSLSSADIGALCSCLPTDEEIGAVLCADKLLNGRLGPAEQYVLMLSKISPFNGKQRLLIWLGICVFEVWGFYSSN
jgi:hypothetical protein